MGHFSETLFERLEPFRRDDPMNILPVDRVLSIYGSLADRAETRGARERLSKHLMKMFIDGEKDEHRLTMQACHFFKIWIGKSTPGTSPSERPAVSARSCVALFSPSRLGLRPLLLVFA
jgi:hypothetical protein